MFKKFLSTIILSFFILFSLSGMAQAKANNLSVKVDIKGKIKTVEFNQQPIINNGITLVPMRNFFEATGASVAWDGKTQTVTAMRDNIKLKIAIGQNTAIINGKSYKIAAKAQLINGYTYVPLRFISEAFGDKVNYDNGVIIIQKNNMG